MKRDCFSELDSVVKPVIDTPNPKTESSKTDEPVEFSAEKPPAECKHFYNHGLDHFNSKSIM